MTSVSPRTTAVLIARLLPELDALHDEAALVGQAIRLARDLQAEFRQ